MRVLSLGAGVQSSTLLLMACAGELALDAAIFADTGWEPAAVYEWLAFLRHKADQAAIPLYTVNNGDIRADALDPTHRFASMPLFVKNADGTHGMARRQCTSEYKLKPIRRELKRLGASRKHPVDLLIGISLDEYTRMRASELLYLRNVYPLVERRLTRGDCLTWLDQHGYPQPQKSACIGCPFRRNANWRELTPEEFADAVDFDRRIRATPAATFGGVTNANYWNGERFLHADLIPLDLVDFRSEQDRGQLELFGVTDGCGALCPADDERTVYA